MKRLLLLLITLGTGAAFAQGLQENTKYMFVRIINYHQYNWSTEELKLDSSTSSGKYFTLSSFDKFSNQTQNIKIRAQNGIVVRGADTLFNFNLNVNDSFYFPYPHSEYFKVDSVYTLNIAGQNSKVISLKGSGTERKKWIENIGDAMIGINYTQKLLPDAAITLKAACRNDSNVLWHSMDTTAFGIWDSDSTCDFAWLATKLSVAKTIDGLEFALYPVPACEVLKIEVAASVTYSLTDLSGRILMGGKAEKGLNELNISALNAGVYFLRIIDGSGTAMRKIVVSD